FHVTGVQTCALPISMELARSQQDVDEWARANVAFHRLARQDCGLPQLLRMLDETWSRMQRYQVYRAAAAERAVQSQPEHQAIFRSEERRVGKESRTR